MSLLEGTSGGHHIQPLAGSGADCAGCSGLCLARLWPLASQTSILLLSFPSKDREHILVCWDSDSAGTFTQRPMSSCVFTVAPGKRPKELPCVFFPSSHGCRRTASGSGSSAISSLALTQGWCPCCKVTALGNLCSNSAGWKEAAGSSLPHTPPHPAVCPYRSCVRLAGECPSWLWALRSILPSPGLFYLRHILAHLSG